MEIKEYTENIVSRLEKLRPELKFTVNEHVKKNNGVELVGITISKDNSGIAPIIYINDYYEQECPINDAIVQILSIYDHHANPDFGFINPDEFLSFDNVKDRIIAKLVNKDKNIFMMNEVPYAQFGDMMVIFAIMVQGDEKGIASARVTNQMMNSWKVNLSQIIEVAYKNTRKLFPMEIDNMHDLLMKMLDERSDLTEEQKEEILGARPEVEMSVVSNKYKCNGSYFITDRKALLKVAKKIKANSFYILPSSIHEFIVIPKDTQNMSEDEMLNMVKEVNETQVPYDAILADNVYVFDSTTEELSTISGTVIPFIA